MYRKLKKIAAVVLASAMLMQGSVQSFAAETGSEAASEVQARTAAETATEAAETQAPETAAPETSAPETTAPETTAAETQAPQTAAPETQAPQTAIPETAAAETQAPQTTATEAQPSQTEAAQEQTAGGKQETKEKSTETEAVETERSERENDGEKRKALEWKAELKAVLPYLFAAETVEGAQKLLDEQEILDGKEGKAASEKLAKLSLRLANAVSSSDVEIINLYADADGKLDTAQLDAKYQNHVIDVTKKYYVVNIIADHADQKLDFSGYELLLSNQKVVYTEASQQGDILYNFAAMDGDAFVDYEGTVTLANSAGLQGTFLAPKAEVQVNSDLAGAVYANSVKVGDSVEELLQIVFVEGGQTEAEETESEEISESGETESEKISETEETETEEISEAGETESEKIFEAEETESEEISESGETESEKISETEETETEAISEAGETETELILETEVVSEVPVETESASETEATETITETEAQTESDTEPVIDMETEAQTGQQEESSQAATLYADNETGMVLTVTLKDENGADQTVEKLTNTVFVLRKDGQVIATNASAADSDPQIRYTGTPISLTLAAGTYVLSQISAETGYQIASDQSFEITADSEAPVQLAVENQKLSGDNTITVTAQAYCSNIQLTAEAGRKTKFYTALFRDADAKERVSDVREAVFAEGAQNSEAVTFSRLADGTYYLAATDANGQKLTDTEYKVVDVTTTAVENASVTFSAAAAQETKKVQLQYQYAASGTTSVYPAGDFSYTATVVLTKTLLDQDGNAMSGQAEDAFRVSLYQDEARKQQVTLYEDAGRTKAVSGNQLIFDMNGQSVLARTAYVKMTTGTASFYLQETDADGQSGNALYTVSYTPESSGKITVSCGQQTAAGITNQLHDTVVKLRLTDGSGAYISGVTMVVKDEKGKVVYDNGNPLTFTSSDTDYVLTNKLTAGKKYYLSQVAAPSGYAPSPDVAFTVGRGTTTEAVMTCSSAKTTDYTITVSKQVYCGEHQVYAQDDTAGTNAKKGSYTFYAALFKDAAHTQKVSDVQTITVKALGGTTAFKNLTAKGTYYVAETDQYGEPLSSDSTRTIKYTEKGKVTMSSKSQTTVIQNVYSSLPDGYRYTARITVTKNVTDTSGAAKKVSDTFYAGIFRKADYSDTPTVIKLELSDASSAYVSRRILLPSSGETTYYIAEVNADGTRINEDTFGYTASIDKATLKVTSGDEASVTLTNQEKSSKVTLYLTKKVYQGTTQKTVNETFYVGLFKDANFTQLYTKPITLNLNGKSELTLKLSLNLGTASKANIYIAEVDKDGNVIKDEASFGYEIKLVNSTAAFTQETREVQTILINSVYGTVTQDDWNQILSSDGNNIAGSGYVSGNGELGTAAQTGDETPIALYVGLMAAAVILILILLVIMRKRRNRRS